MHHATGGYVKMVSGEDAFGLDIDDHGRATTARHGARNRGLQARNTWFPSSSRGSRQTHGDQGEAYGGQIQAGHAFNCKGNASAGACAPETNPD